jgi:hypothetical protein
MANPKYEQVLWAQICERFAGYSQAQREDIYRFAFEATLSAWRRGRRIALERGQAPFQGQPRPDVRQGAVEMPLENVPF